MHFEQDDFQPIHGAANKGHLNIVQLLIDVYGIDPTVKAKVHIATNINVTGHVQKTTMSMLTMPSCICMSSTYSYLL